MPTDDDVRPTAPADLLHVCRELLAYVEAERGWQGEADAEDWILEARAVLAKYAPEPEAPTCPPTT